MAARPLPQPLETVFPEARLVGQNLTLGSVRHLRLQGVKTGLMSASDAKRKSGWVAAWSMQTEGNMPIPIEALQAVRVAESHFGNTLVAVYLYGSAVVGDLRPNSDIDILVILDRPTTQMARAALVAELMEVSGRYPVGPGAPHPLDLTVSAAAISEIWFTRPRSEFVYGEWLRTTFESRRGSPTGIQS